ncbi:MAG: hypothetical protein ACRDE6_00895 [Candidatus Limnocylindria bacterium]
MAGVSGRSARWCAFALALFLALTAAAPVSAAKPVPGPDPGSTDYDAVVAAIDAMVARRSSQAAIDAMLERDFGWIVVGEQSPSEPTFGTLASENSDVAFSVPSVYFNTSAGRYEASASFAWRSCNTGIGGSSEPCYMNDQSGTNMGGYDGFGIRFGKLVSRRGHLFTVVASTGCRQTYPTAADADDSGAVFRNQDRFLTVCDTSHYNWHRGTIVYSFLLRAGCPKGEYKIDTKMAHTWSSTGVSAISVSTGGISVTFSSTSNQWEGVSSPRTWRPCGV